LLAGGFDELACRCLTGDEREKGEKVKENEKGNEDDI